jgi:hypothetical protein
VDRAYRGTGGLSTKKGEKYVGLFNGSGTEYTTETVGQDESGWFHVYICSSRPPQVNLSVGPNRYRRGRTQEERLCQVLEGSATGQNQYDAGGPGDAVYITVFFNHPLITPLPLMDYIPLRLGV